MRGIRYLTIQEIAAINVAVIFFAFAEEAYPSIHAKAAAVFSSLGQNHPFHNANKRTAFTSLVIFLELNGYLFHMETKQAENFTVDMVNHQYTFEQVVGIIESHTTHIKH